MGDTRFQVVYLIVFLTHQSSFYNLYYDNLTRWQSPNWLNLFLCRGGLIFRDCQLKFNRYVQKSKSNPQTQPTYVLDQPLISNGTPTSRVRRPIRPQGPQITLYPVLRLPQTTRRERIRPLCHQSIFLPRSRSRNYLTG